MDRILIYVDLLCERKIIGSNVKDKMNPIAGALGIRVSTIPTVAH